MPDPPDDEKFELVIGGETYADLLHDAASSVFMTQGATTKEMYNETIDEERDRIYLYLGDDAGYLKLWDLDPVIARAGMKPVVAFRTTKTQYNPYRQEKCDVSDYANSLRRTHKDISLP